MSNGTTKTRPYSASSRKKKTIPVKREGRGLGYFGDEKDKLDNFEK